MITIQELNTNLEYDRANIPPALTNFIIYKPLTDNNIMIVIQQRKYMYIHPVIDIINKRIKLILYKQRINCFHISYRNCNICTLQVSFILYRD